jgi:hypothetical protein
MSEMEVILTSDEMLEIFKQNPRTAKNGGFQGLLVRFQQRLDRATGRLLLTVKDARRIRSYAFKYGNGSWENRLRRAFGRVLGGDLNGFAPG